jgi:hypothetical protein
MTDLKNRDGRLMTGGRLMRLHDEDGSPAIVTLDHAGFPMFSLLNDWHSFSFGEESISAVSHMFDYWKRHRSLCPSQCTLLGVEQFDPSRLRGLRVL